MIDESLLSILACPETKKNLVMASAQTVEAVNTAIEQGKIFNKLKQKVEEPVDGGLFREGDAGFMYPVRKGIPILLVEELMDVQCVASTRP